MIDEMRVYSRPITVDEIQAEAAPALGGTRPTFLHLGCVDCVLEAARKSCDKDYHLCTSMELHTAGYHVARTMGYVDWRTHVWTHADAEARAEADAADEGGGSGSSSSSGSGSGSSGASSFLSLAEGARARAGDSMVGVGLCCSDMR